MIQSEKIKGKKLLIIGGLTPLSDLVDLAHRNGVVVGVADYNENTYLKKIADYHHEVSATDIDEIVRLCNNEKYDGIISQFNDMLLPVVAKEAEALGKWAPFSVLQSRMSTDKQFFKETCKKYGLDVPIEFKIETEEDIDREEIKYPVIIKPVDSGGSRGISVCQNRDELADGYRKAVSVSRSRRVIVEQYLPYDEINLTYIIQNGIVQLAAVHDRYFNTQQKGVIKTPDIYIYPSRYVDLYLEKYNAKVIRMLEGIGLKNGSMFIQAIVKDERVYLYEAGMRLNGCKTYQILEIENDYNTFEHLMNYALTGSMGNFTEFNPHFKRWYLTWCVVSKPGAVISAFNGEKELSTYPWFIHNGKRYHEGDMIPKDSAGTLGQLSSRMHIFADTKEQLFERLEKVYELYQPVDNDGNSLLLHKHEIEDLRERLDYQL